jgi:hypothetical protein
MSPGAYFGLEEWWPRRETIATGLVTWAAGGVLAVAVAWCLRTATVRTDAMPETAISVSTPPTEVAADTAGTAKALLMPEDVLVGRRTSISHATPGGSP